MKNNVYIRSNISIKSISLTRIFCILPLLLYGIYKNGIYLYFHHFGGVGTLLKPLLMILGSALIGGGINLFYSYVIKKSKDSFVSAIFSSFHVEYGILLSCVMSINVNLFVYFSVLAVIFFLSKFLNDRVNILCICFLLIYVITNIMGSFSFANAYEVSKSFSLEFMDYLVGRAPGGISSTHIILLALAIFGLSITNNNKTTITIAAVCSYVILVLFLCGISDARFSSILFCNNYLFIVSLIATDSVTSCYTVGGMVVYGVLIGLLSFAFYFINPIVAPFLAILIVSLFNNLIDRKVSVLGKRKK